VRRLRGGGPVAPLVEVRDPGVVVESVKLADDRSGDVVVRLYESLGARTRTRVSTSFPLASAEVCDLLERADADVAALAPVARSEDGLDVSLLPFQVVTLRLRTA
jgi:alpha-mannosidase